MATLLKGRLGVACGHLHHFYLRRGGLSTDREYEFTCPHRNEKARLKPVTGGEQVRFPPPGAVFLSAVPAQGQ